MLTFADKLVGDRFGGVSVVAVLAVVTESPSRVMSALDAHSAAPLPGFQIHVLVESTSGRVRVAATCYEHTVYRLCA